MNNKDPFDVEAEEASVTWNFKIIKKIRSGRYAVIGKQYDVNKKISRHFRIKEHFIKDMLNGKKDQESRAKPRAICNDLGPRSPITIGSKDDPPDQSKFLVFS